MTNINKYGTGFPLKINSEILVSESKEREKKLQGFRIPGIQKRERAKNGRAVKCLRGVSARTC